MEFTFGIVTDGSQDLNINSIIDSIEKEKIPTYEIIIVGNSKVNRKNTTVIEFDETIKNIWITKKKNTICEKAKYENIVLMHDYVSLEPGWYRGFLYFGNDFDVCVTQVKNIDNTRFRDYTIWWEEAIKLHPCFNHVNILLPYGLPNNTELNKYLYINGSVYIIKKSCALKYPLDEKLVWGEGEDVEFSQRLAKNSILMKCNIYSSMKFLKHHRQGGTMGMITQQQLDILMSL